MPDLHVSSGMPPERRRRDADPSAFVSRAVRRALYAPLLLTMAFAAVVVLQVGRLHSSMVEVERAQRAISSEWQGYRLMVDAETSLRGYLLTGDRAFLRPAENANRELPSVVAALRHDGADEAASELRASADQWREYERRIVALREEMGDSASLDRRPFELEQGRHLMDAIRRSMETRVADLYRIRDEREVVARHWIGGMLAGLAGLSVVLGVGIALYVRRDLAELSRAYKEALDDVATSRDDAEAANRLKDEFLSTIGHELRTPLNAILGWTTLLRRRPDDPETRRRAIETIDRNARAQARLVDEVLDVSRVMSGRLKLHVQTVDLAAAVATVVDAVRPASQAKSVQIDVNVERGAEAWGDPGRLQQIVWSLVGNAVKFTPLQGHVGVSARRLDGHVELRVADDGPGIRRDFLPHVFESFRQGDAKATRAHGGLGLGLAIVRQLVEMHGGSVHAESPGEAGGTTFVVDLPAPP